MFTVALIGPDGAGKTTVSRRLVESLPLPAKYLYMGVNPDSSNLALPTTRLVRRIRRSLGAPPDRSGPRDPDAPAPKPRGPLRRALGTLKSLLTLANRLAEEWYRQGAAWSYQRRGYVVLFDRHFFADYYSYDIEPGSRGAPLAARLHAFMLRRLYPRPDLTIYLDAPAEVLFARKGEGTLELLERRRRDYLRMRDVVPCFAVVDASRSEDEVTRDVARVICDFASRGSGRRPEVDHARG
jgi:thymidylate kinase